MSLIEVLPGKPLNTSTPRYSVESDKLPADKYLPFTSQYVLAVYLHSYFEVRLTLGHKRASNDHADTSLDRNDLETETQTVFVKLEMCLEDLNVYMLQDDNVNFNSDTDTK
jgi:hypothetical protein